jgi:hypothetical protein
LTGKEHLMSFGDEADDDDGILFNCFSHFN